MNKLMFAAVLTGGLLAGAALSLAAPVAHMKIAPVSLVAPGTTLELTQVRDGDARLEHRERSFERRKKRTARRAPPERRPQPICETHVMRLPGQSPPPGSPCR